MYYKKLFLFLTNLIPLLYAGEEHCFQPLSTTQQISFFAKNFLQKDLIYGLVGGVASYGGTKLLKRKFPYLKHHAIKYFYASPFVLFSLRDAFLLKNLNASGFDVLKNKTNSNDIEKKFLSIGFENYILKKQTFHINSQVAWDQYQFFKNKPFLFTARFFEKFLSFFLEQKECTRAQEIFSDFLLLDKKSASNVFNQINTLDKIEILSILTKLCNLDELNLEYDLLVQIQDKKKLFNILLAMKDTKLKLSILNTFSVKDIATLYQDQKQEFCSLISAFVITSFEDINFLSDFFEKLFSIHEIDEIDFLKHSEISQRASLLSCFEIERIIKLAQNFSEKFEVANKYNPQEYQELEIKFQSLEALIYERLLPKDKEKKLVSLLSYVRTEHYKKDSNPYGGEENPEEKARYEVSVVEQSISDQLKEKNLLRRRNYDEKKINFFVYFVLSFQHIIASEENKFLSLSKHREFKELGSCFIELII
jgi:hypothetical protein